MLQGIPCGAATTVSAETAYFPQPLSTRPRTCASGWSWPPPLASFHLEASTGPLLFERQFSAQAVFGFTPPTGQPDVCCSPQRQERCCSGSQTYIGHPFIFWERARAIKSLDEDRPGPHGTWPHGQRYKSQDALHSQLPFTLLHLLLTSSPCLILCALQLAFRFGA